MAAQERAARTGGGAASASFEYRSRLRVGRLPLVHVVRGIDPSTGRRPPAVGVIAVGQVAVGLIAIGQVALGAISIGQAAIGLGWGIGQAACGLVAAGQVAAGLLGSVGQVALGPRALGMVQQSGAWVAIGWLLGGTCLLAAILRRRRRLAPLLAAPGAREIRAVREAPGDDDAHVAAAVVSADRLRAPLSGAPCVFWHTVEVGPAVRRHEHGGGEVTIADQTGAARVDLDGPVIFIRSDNYSEIAGPDWALHLETSLAHGDAVHVAGPVTLAPDRDAGGAYRGGLSPVFAGRPERPLVITTRNPLTLRAELRFAAALAWTSLAGGLVALVALSI
ncbi:MAG TPA: hypothetical protein VHO06_01590 [Polyangia bacterium]|nr:hypothetical protein [Polyangia bacterium]